MYLFTKLLLSWLLLATAANPAAIRTAVAAVDDVNFAIITSPTNNNIW